MRDWLALADWRRRVSALYSDVRSMEPEKAHAHWLKARTALFYTHPQSPLAAPALEAAEPIPCFPYDPALRFAVEIEQCEGAPVTVDLGADGQLSQREIGQTKGLAARLGQELTLFWIEGYGGGLFLPFKDATNGRETYGGGRYLIDAIKGADLGVDDRGKLNLDFNFAYHPSCAHNPIYTCPLAPAKNALPVPIEAGERL